jgi:curved DNA-binding protein CbpA
MTISSKLLIFLSIILKNLNINAITTDYYALLGIDKYCKEKDIKKVYRKLALEYHPDKISNNIGKNHTLEWQGKKIDKEEAKELFLKIQEAYEILSDEEKKIKYDLSLDGIQVCLLNLFLKLLSYMIITII